ncbi:hypothetical protein LTS15_006749 [Exophiala xenobiotica]|nr:hypothetical protein LTS15_006749 [Exophiala xenobiotica]
MTVLARPTNPLQLNSRHSPNAFSANGNNVILQVNDVDPGIAALFGVGRQLRREVKDFFWRYYRLRIRPVSMVLTRFDGIETTFRQLRKVLLLEVIHPLESLKAESFDNR